MKRSASLLVLLLFLSIFMVAFPQINSVKAQDRIYIREDGSVEGTDKIRQNGDVYTLTGSISRKGIVVQKSDIVIDGNGYTLSSPPAVGGYNILLIQLNNVTIKDMIIKDGYIGIFIEDCTHVTVSGNNVTICDPNFFYIAAAIRLENGGFHIIVDNTITNSQVGIWITKSSHNNRIYHNNFLSNKYHVFGAEEATSMARWDNGYPSGGNYWSDYNGIDLYSGVYQNETGSDSIGDTPYVFIVENETLFTDNYPLMEPVPVIPEFPSWTPMLLFLVVLTVAVAIYKRRLPKKLKTQNSH